jgi:biofilm PGA synthesis lipoprotein PgaB
MTRQLFLSLSLIFVFIPIGNALILVEPKYDKINGIQIFNLNFNRDELHTFLGKVKENGFNTIMLRVFHNEKDRYHYGEASVCNSGVYYKTKKICTVNDILGEFIQIAHSYNLKVYAWMATRSLSALKDIYGVDETFVVNGTKRNGYGINLFNEKVFSDIEQLFKDLLQYDIDGILIQDDFILKYDESASKEALHKFYVDTGIDLNNRNIDNEIVDKFAEWKVNQLAYYINKIVWDVKFLNPSIKVALNVYYETPLYIKNAKRWYAQSIEVFKNTGIDYFTFMAYHKQIEEESNLEFFDAASLINSGIKYLIDSIEPDSRVISKFQIKAFQNKEYIDNYEFEKLCSLLNVYDKVGIIVLPVENHTDLQYSCSHLRR